MLIEPYEHTGEAAPSLLSVGSGLSDYQVVHRVRKHDIYQWAVMCPETRWRSSIMDTITRCLDALTYCAFGKDGKRTSVHDTSRIVVDVQSKLLDMMDTWADDSSPIWVVVDAVTGQKRSSATEDLRRYLRKTIAFYTSSMLRRYELPAVHTEKPIHDVTCPECSPTPESRRQAWERLTALAPCCQSFFARRVSALSPTADEQSRDEALLVLQVRDDMRMASTKISESNHAHCQKLLQKSSKPLSLATFARRIYLNRIYTAYVHNGGTQSGTCGKTTT